MMHFSKNVNLMNKCLVYYSVGFVILCCIMHFITGVSVQIRVVKETANYGYFGQNTEARSNQLTLKVSPSDFSGPQLLKRLIGKCYNFSQNQYLYIFCPFQNFSQYELTQRWNAYSGILGVWSHWSIQNNTFSSMEYHHGDSCGDKERSVKVYLQCGPTETLFNVTEPTKCSYAALFHTRYVCHMNSLLVYPRLKLHFQRQWNQLFTDYHNGDITKKGYYINLENVFEAAGFLQKRNFKISPNVATEATILTGSLFTDLSLCNKEYRNLAKEITHLSQEIDALKLLQDLAKIGNKTL